MARSSVMAASSTTRTSTPAKPSPSRMRCSQEAIVRAGMPASFCRLCAAIVDRLTFGGDIIETGSGSYRLAHTRARVAAQDGTAS